MHCKSMKHEDEVQVSTDAEIYCLLIEEIVVYRCYNTLSMDSEVKLPTDISRCFVFGYWNLKHLRIAKTTVYG